MKGLQALAVILVASLATASLAQEKKAVEWEMTTYYVGMIHKGPKWTAEHTPETQKIFEGHMANIRRLGESGKLLVAGPFADDGDLQGMFVFKVASLEEARALCDTDPAVQAGRLRVELHPWYAAKNILVFPTAPAERKN